MTRGERIANLKTVCAETASNAVAAHIKLGGPYLKTKYGSKYRVTIRITFRPWPKKHPNSGWQSAYEFDCRSLSGARRAVRDLWDALPSDATVHIEGK